MGIIEIDKLDTLLARHAELKVAVDAFGQTLNEVQRYANETNIVVKSIYNGDSIPDWIEDLKTNKKNSETYRMPERMKILYTNPNVCADVEINHIVFDYVVDNSLNVGSFLEGCIGAESDVIWSSLPTLDAICKSNAAFASFSNNNVAVDAVVNSTKAVNLAEAIVGNYNVTESIFFASSVLKNKYKGSSMHKGTDAHISTNTIILYFTDGDSISNTRDITLTYLDGSTYTYDHTGKKIINRFVKKIELTDSSGGGKANWTEINYFSLKPYKGELN